MAKPKAIRDTLWSVSFRHTGIDNKHWWIAFNHGKAGIFSMESEGRWTMKKDAVKNWKDFAKVNEIDEDDWIVYEKGTST